MSPLFWHYNASAEKNSYFLPGRLAFLFNLSVSLHQEQLKGERGVPAVDCCTRTHVPYSSGDQLAAACSRVERPTSASVRPAGRK